MHTNTWRYSQLFTPDIQRVENSAALGNSPMWFGEWSISTNFNATDAFLKDWADAQKLAYSKGAGWIVRISFPSQLVSHVNASFILVLELQDRRWE